MWVPTSVEASIGHIRDLPAPIGAPSRNEEGLLVFAVDIDHDFDPYYVVNADKKKGI